jgi:hypothetical protein
MADGHKPTPSQKRRAVLTAVVLAVLAIGIYATVVLKFTLTR